MQTIDMLSEWANSVRITKTLNILIWTNLGEFCPIGVISFIFDIKAKGLPNEGKSLLLYFNY